MAITMQALQWGMNPFSVAQKSYKIKDVIAYEAQLIAAVINTRADLKRRPQISFEGEGDARQCTVSFEFNDGSVQIYVSPPVSRITPKNSPLWKTDPDQQLSYYSIRAGGRRYCPEVILGVYDRDEVEEFRGPDAARDVTPKSPVMERLQARSATQNVADGQEGFSPHHVQRETESVLTGEIINTNTAPQSPPAGPVDDAHTPVSSEADDRPTSDPGTTGPAGDMTQSAGSPSLFPASFDFTANELQHLKDFARKALDDATGDETLEVRLIAIDRMRMMYLDALEGKDARAAVEAIDKAVDAVAGGKRSRTQAADYIARDIIGCQASELESLHHG
jgi:hypothetical protein